MNAPKKYVVSKTLRKPTWRDTTIIRDNVIESVRALKARWQVRRASTDLLRFEGKSEAKLRKV